MGALKLGSITPEAENAGGGIAKPGMLGSVIPVVEYTGGGKAPPPGICDSVMFWNMFAIVKFGRVVGIEISTTDD